MPALSEYFFQLESAKTDKYEFFKYGQNDNPLFRRIFMSDSIFQYFPSLECVINDIIGDTTEITYFVENLSVSARLGHSERGIIAHDFFWSESQLNDVQRAATIQGNWFWFFESDFEKQDFVKSQSFKGTIHSVVDSLVSKYIYSPDNRRYNGLVGNGRFIDETSNENFWYQDSVSDSVFIRKLAQYAYSPSYKNSPFLTFFNLKGEFYFRPFAKFFENPDAIVANYTLDAQYAEEDFLANYSIQFAGSSFNRPNYNVNFFSIGTDGSNESTTKTLSSQSISSKDTLGSTNTSKVRLPIRKKDLSTNQRMSMFGIVENEDGPDFNGWMNTQFLDTLTAYRMTLTVPFNPELASGRLINLTVTSKFEVDKSFATEYCGNWLITESNHLFNPMTTDKGPDAPYTQVSLIKPSINVWTGNKFVDDFISVPT